MAWLNARVLPPLRSRWMCVTVGVASLPIITLLARSAPLTYDEAFNRVYYERFGVGAILETYNAPNNHLPFTVLQSLIPQGLLDWNPWTIRAFSVLSGLALVAMVIGVARWRRSSPLIGLMILVGSPLLTTYLFLARGYGFSSVFLGLAVLIPVVLSDDDSSLRGACAGACALAIAAWTIPTNLFAAPGWVGAVWALFGLRRAIVGGVVYIITLALTLGPIESQIVATSDLQVSGYGHWWHWQRDVVTASSRAPLLLVAVLLLAIAATVNSLRRPRIHNLSQPARVALLAFATSMSWFVFLGGSRLAGVDLPFVRNAVPALLLGVVGIAAVFPRGRLEIAAILLLAPACISAVLLWSNAIHGGNWEAVARTSHTDVLLGTTPVGIGGLHSIGADSVTCSEWDFQVCSLVTPFLRRSGITVNQRVVNYRRDLPCASGSRRPPPPWQVEVYRHGRLLGVLCH